MILRAVPMAVAFCVLALCYSATKGADTTASEGDLTIPGVCTIGTPGKGWAWKPVKAYEPGKGGAYVCSAEAKPGKVILTIDPRKIEGDDQRMNALKVDFNNLHHELEKIGCTEIKGKRPNLTPPIGDDVDYLLFGKTPKGTSVYFAAHTIFKDQTFLVQAAAPSLEQTQKLADVAKTLKKP